MQLSKINNGVAGSHCARGPMNTTIDQEFAACNKAFVEGDNTLFVQYERLQEITCSFSSAVAYIH